MNYSISKIAKEDALLKAMVTDLSGKFRELIFPIKYIKELCTNGMPYDGSSFSWINSINISDSVLLWQEDTIILCPQKIWETEKPEYWIICDIVDKEWIPHPNCVRSKLKILQKELASTWNWWNLYVWAEPEAYFIKDDTHLLNMQWWNANYFNTKSAHWYLIAEITNTLQEIWFDIERAHTEAWEDQFEINWKFDLAENTCDKIQLFKLITHKVVKKHGLYATFLPKPFPNRSWSWMHFHISVLNTTDNLFYSDNNEKYYNISDEALSFLQEILNSVRSISVISNKSEASYARLVPWFEAPNIIALWAVNRSTACRIPIITDKKGRKKWLRAEFRFPDPLANPYLLACAFIVMWMEWLSKKTKFKWFTNDNLYELSYQETLEKWYKFMPRNLWEAYLEYNSSNTLKNRLWNSIFEAYWALILEEIEECQSYADLYSLKKHYLR